MGADAGGRGWVPRVDLGGWFDTLGLVSAFPLYMSLIFLGCSFLNLTKFDSTAISVAEAISLFCRVRSCELTCCFRHEMVN